MAQAIEVGISLYKQIKLMKNLVDIDDSYRPIYAQLLEKQKEFFAIEWDRASLQMYLEAFEEEIRTRK